MDGRHHTLAYPLLAAAVAMTLAPTLAGAITLTWSSGDFVTGITAPEPLTALDILEINSGGTKRFVGTTFTNLSLVRWLADPVQGGNGAVVNNLGEWRSESDANSLTWNFGAQALFVNTGSFSKSAGSVTNVGSWRFVNDGGLIDAQMGTIVFNSASNVFNSGSRFTGAGAVQIAGGSVFNGNFQSDNLTLSGGTQNGNNAALIGGSGLSAGLLGWSGGDLSGTWTIAAGTTMTASGAASKRQVGSNIVNNGTFRWSTTEQLQGGNGSVFTNNGVLEATESAVFNWNFGAQHQLTNNASGTVRATSNATLNIGAVALTSHGGLFEADAGSSIEYSGTSNRFNDGTRFTGLNRVTGSARFVDTITSNDLRFVSGTQTGGDGVTVGSRGRLAGVVGFEGGDLSGAWEIKSGAVMTATGVASKRQLGSDLVNNGTITWSSDAALQGGNGSRLLNNGRFELASDADLTWNFGSQARFDNAGLLLKSAGTGDSSQTGLALTNTGTIDLRSGSMSLPANFINDGTLTGSGTFNVVGTLLNNGHLAPGSSPGTLTINGGYQQSALGTLDIELQSSLSHDLLLISGNASLAGTLGIACFANCSYAVGDEILILDAVGQLSGSFASVIMTGFATGAFDVVYDTLNDRVLLRVTEAVTAAAVPLPGGGLLLLGGLVSLGAMVRRRRVAH